MAKNDFSGEIGGKEYDLFMAAYPHYADFQDRIANAVVESTSHIDGLVNVLEIGTGTGATTQALLDASERFNIVSVEMEPQMVAQARINLKDYVGRVEIVEAEAVSHLKHAPWGTFDAVVSGFTLHNSPQVQKYAALKSIYNVLKEGGSFTLGDKLAQRDPVKHQAAFEYTIGLINAAAEKYDAPSWGKKWVDHYIFDETKNIIMYEDTTIKQMAEFGYSHIKSMHRTHMDAIWVARK